MSRVKQFIYDHSPEFSNSEIQSLIHSTHSSQKVKKQILIFIQFCFLLLKINNQAFKSTLFLVFPCALITTSALLPLHKLQVLQLVLFPFSTFA